MRLADAGRTVVLLSAVALAAPAVAGAHLRIGEVAVDARVTIVRPRPSSDAVFAVSVRESDRSFRLTVQPGHRVVVLGYLAERFLRVDARGVAVSLASPTAAEAGLVPAGGRRNAGWSTTPGHTAVWRDPRVQRLAPGVNRVSWTVPIVVDGRPRQIAGELVRVRRPSLWPWALVVLGAVALGGCLAFGRRPRRLSAGCVALGSLSSVAALVTAGAFAVDAAAPGTRIAAVYALVLIAPAAGALVFAPPVALVPAGTWLAAIGLTTTLVDTNMFFHGFVLSALPAAVTRAAGALAIGTGVGGALLGGLYFAGGDARYETIPP